MGSRPRTGAGAPRLVRVVAVGGLVSVVTTGLLGTSAAGSYASGVRSVAVQEVSPISVASVTRGFPWNGGGPFTVTGSGLSTVTGVTVNGQSVAFSIASDTELNGTAPALSFPTSSDVAVTLTGTGGTVTTTLRYEVQVTITSVTPSRLDTYPPGSITVIGTGFQPDARVTIRGASTTTNVVSPTELGVRVDHPGAATEDVTVTSGGQVVTAVNAVTFERLLPATPGRPRAVRALPAVRAAVVSWRPPSSYDPDIAQYVVRAIPGGRVCWTAEPERTCTVTGLSNGVAYRFTVTVVADPGSGHVGTSTGAPSVPSAAIIVGSPTPPRIVRVAFRATANARVTWGTPVSPGSGPITAYQVRWSGRAGRTWTPWVSTGTVRYASRTRMVKGHEYLVQVRAVNASGAGPASTLTFRQAR